MTAGEFKSLISNRAGYLRYTMDLIELSSPLRILLVEENERDRFAFRKAVKNNRITSQISDFAYAEEALAQLSNSKKFDLVAISSQLPDKSGLDFCKELLEKRVPFPIILFIRAGEESVAAEALEAGVDQYILKDTDQGYLKLLPAVLEEVARKGLQRMKKQRGSYTNNIIELTELAREKERKRLVKKQEENIAEHTRKLSKTVDRLEHVHEIAEAVSAATTLEDRMQAVVQGMVNHLGFDIAIVSLFDTETETLTLTAIYPLRNRLRAILKIIGLDIAAMNLHYKPGESPIRDQLMAGKPYLGHSATDLLSPPLFRRAIEVVAKVYKIQTLLDTPLLVEGEVVGCLLVATRQPEISPEKQHAVDLVARQAESAIESARFLEQLQRRTSELETTLAELEKTHSTLEQRVEERTAEIQNQKEFFEALILNSPIAIVMLDLDNKIVSCNPAFEALFGYSLSEVEGQNLDGFVAPEHSYEEAAGYTQEVLAGKTIRGTGKRCKKNGELVDVEIFGVPVNVENEQIGVLGLYNDISERVRAEEALHKSEQRYQMLFESAPDAYYMTDLKGTFWDGNKAAEELVGYKREELIGRSFLDLHILPPKQVPKAAKLLALNALGKPTGPDEFILNHKDGTQVDVAIRTYPAKINNKTLVLGIARDITQRKRMQERLLKINRDLSLFNRVSQEISAGLEPEQVYSAVYRAASQLIPADVFIIALSDEANQEIDLVYLVEREKRIPSMRIHPDQGLSGHVISTGQQLCSGDFLGEYAGKINLLGDDDPLEIASSVLAVPMKRGEKTIGMLSAQCFQPNAYTDHDQQMLEMLSSHASFGLENAYLFEEIQRLAITDKLTGLYNRHYFDFHLELESDRSRRYGRPLGLIIMDIDYFKEINDQFGHLGGDEVLAALASLIKNTVRKSDIVARYGGDEFVILLPETDLSGASTHAEKIQQAVAQHTFKYQQQDINLTVSVGVTALSDNRLANPYTLIKQADQTLYQAKRGGRNMICSFDDQT